MSYYSRLVVDKLTLSMVETSATEDERTIRVMTKPGTSWELVLPIWYDPSVSILSETSFAIWAGCSLYVVDHAAPPVEVDFDDEIHAVYRLEHRLCIVGELSVSVYDPARAVVVDSYQAKDVLGDSWWEGDRLWVEAWEEPPIQFAPTADSVGGPLKREG